CSFMIGFERWMRRRHELDSNNCHVERSEISLFAADRRFDQIIRDSSLRSEWQENTREATDHQLAANAQFPSRCALPHRRLRWARFRRVAALAGQSWLR